MGEQVAARIIKKRIGLTSDQRFQGMRFLMADKHQSDMYLENFIQN